METPRLYTVTGQNQVRAFDQGRNLVDHYEIYYEGPDGIKGSVRVPVASATADLVNRTIQRQLSEQLKISQLGAAG